jgi:hypothetical protein
MNTKHTTGPWNAADTGNHQGMIIAEQDGATVAVTYDAKDARLIAAAPELLETLQRILYAHDSAGNGAAMGEATLCPAYANMARQVIAKAVQA